MDIPVLQTTVYDEMTAWKKRNKKIEGKQTVSDIATL